MVRVPRNVAEKLNRPSRVHECYRQTTDGRAIAYSEREREFTFAKNDSRQVIFCFNSVREIKNQIPLRYLVRTSYEPASVMEFGFKLAMHTPNILFRIVR